MFFFFFKEVFELQISDHLHEVNCSSLKLPVLQEEWNNLLAHGYYKNNIYKLLRINDKKET